MAPILGIWASGATPSKQNSYESIATTTVGIGGVTSVTFSSIPSTYTHLQVRVIANAPIGVDLIKMRTNSNTTNYGLHWLTGNGSSASSSSATSASAIYVADVATSSNQFSASVIDILDYTNTNKYKVIRSLAGYDSNGSGSIRLWSGANYSDLTAVTSLTFLLDSGLSFAQYSSFALYGIKG
jgi:hypothetical protein